MTERTCIGERIRAALRSTDAVRTPLRARIGRLMPEHSLLQAGRLAEQRVVVLGGGRRAIGKGARAVH